MPKKILLASNIDGEIIIKEKGLGHLYFCLPMARNKTAQTIKNWLKKYQYIN